MRRFYRLQKRHRNAKFSSTFIYISWCIRFIIAVYLQCLFAAEFRFYTSAIFSFYSFIFLFLTTFCFFLIRIFTILCLAIRLNLHLKSHHLFCLCTICQEKSFTDTGYLHYTSKLLTFCKTLVLNFVHLF